jgi:hypothetical protein
MVDAGIAVGMDASHSESEVPEYILLHLTSAGHDFADSARNQYIWDEVYADMRRKGVILSHLLRMPLIQNFLHAQELDDSTRSFMKRRAFALGICDVQQSCAAWPRSMWLYSYVISGDSWHTRWQDPLVESAHPLESSRVALCDGTQ